MKEIDKYTLKEAAAGNLDAFEAVLCHYEGLVFNIAYRMFHNTEDAKDILQEVFIKVYKYIGSCKELDHFKSWICTVTTNACLDELRKRKAQKAEDPGGSKTGAAKAPAKLRVITDGKTPEDAVIDRESWAELQQAIDSLSDDDRLLIILRDIHGLSYAELAAALSLNLGTVKSRLSRARYKLRNILLERKQNETNND